MIIKLNKKKQAPTFYQKKFGANITAKANISEFWRSSYTAGIWVKANLSEPTASHNNGRKSNPEASMKSSGK